MNKITALFMLMLTMIAYNAIGQQPITVTDDSLTTDEGRQFAYMVRIPDAEPDDVIKAWSKAIRQNTKSRTVQDGNQVSIVGTLINEIYSNPIDIYSIVYKTDSSVRVIAAFEIDSMFFSPPPPEATHAELQTQHSIQNFMRTFAIDEYKSVVQGELDQEEAILKNLNREYKDLVKENEDFQKDIKENEQDIRNSNDAIATFENDNSRLLAQINGKRNTIAGLTGDEELRRQAQDQLKDLEKEKKNIEKKLTKEQKDIVKNESAIKELNREIELNLEKQEVKKNQISAQEDVVKAIDSKLKNIK